MSSGGAFLLNHSDAEFNQTLRRAQETYVSMHTNDSNLSGKIAREAMVITHELQSDLNGHTGNFLFYVLLAASFFSGVGLTAMCLSARMQTSQRMPSRVPSSTPRGVEEKLDSRAPSRVPSGTPEETEDKLDSKKLHDASLKIQTTVAKYPRAGMRGLIPKAQHRFLAAVPENASQQDETSPTLDHWRRGSLAWWRSKDEFEQGVEPSGSVLLHWISKVKRGRDDKNCEVTVRHRTVSQDAEGSEDGSSELILQFPNPGFAEEWSDNIQRFLTMIQRLRLESAEDGSTLHVKGVKSGPRSSEELTRIFSQFGEVVQVTIREKTDKKTGADASWALVTMESSKAVQIALQLGVKDRMDPPRPITVSLFSKSQASKSVGAMGKVRQTAMAKLSSSSVWQRVTGMMSNNDESEDIQNEEGKEEDDTLQQEIPFSLAPSKSMPTRNLADT